MAEPRFDFQTSGSQRNQRTHQPIPLLKADNSVTAAEADVERVRLVGCDRLPAAHHAARVNCLLSFLYALVRHDCIAALTCVGLDPFVGFLHVDPRPNRPSLALDLMEEFRPWLADRLAVTLINRQQIQLDHFVAREGGAVEFTEGGRKLVIKAYQEREKRRT